MTLPIKVRGSLFFTLAAIKKIAHKTKSIHPAKWYLFSCSL